MSTKRKRRIKIKKKNFTIFLIIIFIIGFSLYKGITFTVDKVSSMFDTKPPTVTLRKEEEKPPIIEKDLRLEKLDNINERINYFNDEYIDRYVSYRDANPDLEIEKVILEVNMNLDKKFYEDVTEATNYTPEILVNKYNYLSDNYVPDNLKSISTNYARSGMQLIDYAKEAFEEMASDARKDKMRIIAMSSYRSYTYQVNLYNRYVKQDGKDAADTYSGRPGFSEHQTGLAVDVYDGEIDYTKFEKTNEFKWMQENAYKYGFVLRFPENKEKYTGYKYESWHYRYVGKDIAFYMHENNLCLEEYHALKEIKKES